MSKEKVAKEFAVGCLFIVGLIILLVVVALLSPLLLVMGILLRVLLVFLFMAVGIWLLGKLVLFLWRSIR
jgi:hypothetical protein